MFRANRGGKTPSKAEGKGKNKHLLSHNFWGQESRCGLIARLWLEAVPGRSGLQSQLGLQ